MIIQNPSFIVFCGPMFSAKTTRLIMECTLQRHKKKNVRIFKPAFDTRQEFVETHLGTTVDAIAIHDGADMLKILADDAEKIDIVAIDEMFMVKGSAEVLRWLYMQGVSIIVASLDYSFNGEIFKEFAQVLPYATRIEKCIAACAVCGDDAQFTHKKNGNDMDKLLDVGGSEMYEPRCFEHFAHINERFYDE